MSNSLPILAIIVLECCAPHCSGGDSNCRFYKIELLGDGENIVVVAYATPPKEFGRSESADVVRFMDAVSIGRESIVASHRYKLDYIKYGRAGFSWQRSDASIILIQPDEIMDRQSIVLDPLDGPRFEKVSRDATVTEQRRRSSWASRKMLRRMYTWPDEYGDITDDVTLPGAFEGQRVTISIKSLAVLPKTQSDLGVIRVYADQSDTAYGELTLDKTGRITVVSVHQNHN